MKAIPSRKGNAGSHLFLGNHADSLDESPYQEEGKRFLGVQRGNRRSSLNESPH